MEYLPEFLIRCGFHALPPRLRIGCLLTVILILGAGIFVSASGVIRLAIVLSLIGYAGVVYVFERGESHPVA